MTLLPLRTLISLGGFLLACVLLNFVMIGHDMSKPARGFRSWLRAFTITYVNWLIPLSAFMDLRYETIHYDYSYYLGPDYEKTQKLPKKAPTVVANHQAWIDNMICVLAPMCPGMAAKIETKKVWILNRMIEYTQGIFITRGGETKNDRDKQI